MGKPDKKHNNFSNRNNKFDDDYNLTKGFNRINNYRQSNSNYGPTTKVAVPKENYMSLPADNSYPTNTNLQELTSPSWENFTSLSNRFDDKIGTLSNKNEDQHAQLRKELEDKIDDKVGKIEFRGLFYGAVTIIGIIGLLIYNLSYKDILDNSRIQKNYILRVDSLYKSVNHLEEQIATIYKTK
jgi:hypothetical protein